MKAWVLHDIGDAEGGDDRTHHRTDFTGIINVIQVPIWKKDLIITDCETQKDMKRLGGARSVCLDAYGTDPDMKKYDLETQRVDKGAESIEQGIV